MKLPLNLIERVEDEIISLTNVPTHTLIDWLKQSSCYYEKELINNEIYFRWTPGQFKIQG